MKIKATALGFALALATGAFWWTMLVSPPQSIAFEAEEMNIAEMSKNTPLDLPILQADPI